MKDCDVKHIQRTAFQQPITTEIRSTQAQIIVHHAQIIVHHVQIIVHHAQIIVHYAQIIVCRIPLKNRAKSYGSKPFSFPLPSAAIGF